MFALNLYVKASSRSSRRSPRHPVEEIQRFQKITKSSNHEANLNTEPLSEKNIAPVLINMMQFFSTLVGTRL